MVWEWYLQWINKYFDIYRWRIRAINIWYCTECYYVIKVWYASDYSRWLVYVNIDVNGRAFIFPWSESSIFVMHSTYFLDCLWQIIYICTECGEVRIIDFMWQNKLVQFGNVLIGLTNIVAVSIECFEAPVIWNGLEYFYT